MIYNGNHSFASPSISIITHAVTLLLFWLLKCCCLVVAVYSHVWAWSQDTTGHVCGRSGSRGTGCGVRRQQTQVLPEVSEGQMSPLDHQGLEQGTARILTRVRNQPPEWNFSVIDIYCHKLMYRNSLFDHKGIFSATPAWLACVLQCSVTCGEGVRRREVKCIRNKHRTVEVSECRNATRPALVEACTLQECTRFQWVTAPWSKVCLFMGNSTPQECTRF